MKETVDWNALSRKEILEALASLERAVETGLVEEETLEKVYGQVEEILNPYRVAAQHYEDTAPGF